MILAREAAKDNQKICAVQHPARQRSDHGGIYLQTALLYENKDTRSSQTQRSRPQSHGRTPK